MKKEEMYYNYHCHSMESNKSTQDSITSTQDYCDRAKELGHNAVFTTEHGISRNQYRAYDTISKNELKTIYGVEAYYTDDINYMRHQDDEFVIKLFLNCVKKVTGNINYEYDKIELTKILNSKNNIKKLSKMFNLTEIVCNEISELFNTQLNTVKKLDRKNYHIFIGALTNNARRKINKITSKANTHGFYKKPRIDLNMLLSLPKDEVVITTACVAGRLFSDNYLKKFLLPVKEHFDNSLYLEVQSHNCEIQANHNRKILELAEEYDIEIIHGNDSHYIYEEDREARSDYILGKRKKVYDDEGDFTLDYPSYNEILRRYEEQGVLTKEQAIKSLKNTLIFDKAEDLNFTKEIKMPTIYPDLSVDERFDLLKNKVVNSFKQKVKNNEIDRSKLGEYKEGIFQELKIIKDTNLPDVRTADYFLTNEKIIEQGIKNGGILTKTGRGSGGGFYLNNLLGFTNIDRFDVDVPLYPTRFMSASRILDAMSLPDIDFNTADTQPFIDAQKQVLGEDHAYYMVADGTLKRSGAFRLMCKIVTKTDKYKYILDKFSSPEELKNKSNEVGKKLTELEKLKGNKFDEKYREILKDDKFSDIILLSERFIGVIDSVSPSPCSHLLLNDSISEEIGLTRVGDPEKNEYVMCCNIDGLTADTWKFLKNDLLVVTVWEIIGGVYKAIGKPIPSVKELKDNLLDDKVWELYREGLTKTLNQADSNFATPLVMKYSPENYSELCAWVAAIRPSFASQLNGFLNRIDYTTGVEQLDELLSDSFHYLLYQENLMKFFTWLGIKEDKTYGLIKKIAKKKMKEKEQEDLEIKLRNGWIERIGNDDEFDESWQIVKDSAKYLFNSAHSICVAFDSLYGAYLKSHYPLEYYTTVFNIYTNKNNTDKIAELTPELNYFKIRQKPIKFGFSKSNYVCHKETNSIYKGLQSLKYLNEQVSNELYELRNNSYDDFVDLLADIESKTSLDSRQLDILTALGFFKDFGKSKKLLETIDIYNNIAKRRQVKKADIEKLGLNYDIIARYSKKETEKLFKEFDGVAIAKELSSKLENKSISAKELMSKELDYLGYINFKHNKFPENVYFVSGFKTYKDKAKPYLELYRIKTGETIKAKITKKKLFVDSPFKERVLIRITDIKKVPKKTKVDDKWVVVEGEFNNVIEGYEVY